MIEKKYLQIPFFVFFSLLLCGILLDFKINMSLYSSNQILCISMASIGEWPAYGGLALCGGIILGCLKKLDYKKGIKVILFVFAIASILFSIYYFGKAFTSKNAWGAIIPKINELYISLLEGSITMIPFIAIGVVLSRKNDARELTKVALAMMITIFASFLITTSLKEVFQRPRFRFLYESDSLFLYTPYLTRFTNVDYVKELEGFAKEELRSFPSGHTAYSSTLMVWGLYSPKLFHFTKKKSAIFLGIGTLYGLLVAFTRIVLGAHFLTDISSGAIITWCCMYVGYTCYTNAKNKETLLKEEAK